MVELRDISYRAGNLDILQHVDVRFRPGRFNVILGPNGAGKSTLLRIATGLAQPASGEVRYADRTLSSFDSQELARTRAVLTQHVELAFALPVAEVVMMGRYPHFGRVPSPRDRTVVRDALDIVGMIHKESQPYPTLSGGEQQKVQLARVLAQIWTAASDTSGHRYLFLDEPTTNLDVHYQLHVLSIARSLLDERTTIVAILHDLNTAFQFGDQFLILHEGRVALDVDGASAIPVDVLERVFAVQVRRIIDAESKDTYWRFGLGH